MKKLFGAIVLILALSGCNKQREIVLQKEAASLRLEVSNNKQMHATLQQIERMMDSVDVLRAKLSQGAYSDNPDRLREINRFLTSMLSRSNEIEKSLEKGTGAAAVYSELITKLRGDLATKTLEFNALAEQVAYDKALSDTLRMIVEQQTAEINDGAAVLGAINRELLQLEEEIKQLSIDTKSGSMDSYQRRALALEKAARRTHMAIQKSKSL